MLDDVTSLSALVKSLSQTFAEGVRRNKLAACLSTFALILSTALSLTSEFDERPRYRQTILPEIQRAEEQFLRGMQYAVDAPSDDWRIYYFITAHRSAKDVLRVAKSQYPVTAKGRRAHDALIRYYEFVNEELAIIRTEMSLHLDYDYMAEWNRRNVEFLGVREQWSRWVNDTGPPLRRFPH
jgi:hypothetical protein